ncbi:MAG: hypothetical protein A07HN63_00378 [uncultured archaeon A07HN63]|nr:MAG: hypothetical protein A07HN63_00378 [uncultured archaeon A07HN63]
MTMSGGSGSTRLAPRPRPTDDEQIEPEAISPEHATFVAIGVLLTVAVIATGL